MSLFGFGFEEGAFGESAESEIGVADLEEIPCIGHRFGELGERKRSHRDGLAASAEFGGYILREQIGVGAGDVCGDVLTLEKSVENMVEGDVGFWAVFCAQARKIRTFWQNRFCMLDFIDEYETWGVVSGKACADFLAEGNCIAAEKKIIRFEVDFHDMVWGDTSTKQMLFEEVEEKKTLPTTPYTNQNLDQIMVFRLYQLVQKDISFDNHYHVSALMLCASARKFKTQVFYHNAIPRSMSALNFCASAQKFKIGVGYRKPFRRVADEALDEIR